LPNSGITKEAHSWLKAHGMLSLVDQQFTRKKKATPKNKKVQKDKATKSKEYREKLKQKMNEMLEEEKKNAAIEEEPIAEETLEEEGEEEQNKLRLGLGTAGTFTLELAPIDREVVEIQIPLTIERLMNYDWLPFDSVLRNLCRYFILKIMMIKIPTLKVSP
jgi:hypothetical protein